MTPLIAQGNLMVVLFNGYGDAFLALPVLREITRRFRRYRVYLACFESQTTTLFHDLEVDFVAGQLADKKLILDKEIKESKFQQLVSFNAYYPNSVEQEIIESYPTIPRWGFCDTTGVPDPKLQNTSLHMRDQYFEVIGWKSSYSTKQRQVQLSYQTRQRFDKFLFHNKDNGNQRFYTLHLDSLPEKMWNLENWIDVIKYLWLNWKARPLILGEETLEAEKLLREFSFALKLPSTLGIDVHFAAVKATNFFIGIDSIFAHVADSLQKRMIVLFGPSDETCWGVNNPNSTIVKSRHGASMNNISSAEVQYLLGQVIQPNTFRKREKIIKTIEKK